MSYTVNVRITFSTKKAINRYSQNDHDATDDQLNMIPKFDGGNFGEWTRSFNDIYLVLQIYLALSKQIGIGIRPEPFPRESRDGEDNDSSPSELVSDIKA